MGNLLATQQSASARLRQRNEQGFTIIEVVLVLAIAGLIFLVVFLALPQLQSSRRDNQRKNDAARIQAALTTFASSNNGNYPTEGQFTSTRFIDYLPAADDFTDPSSGQAYEITMEGVSSVSNARVTSDTTPGQVYYARQAACGGDQMVEASNNRDIAVVIALEAGSYCVGSAEN